MCICRPFVAKDVTLYAASGSAETRDAEDYLGRKGIRYERLDISIDERARDELVRLTGQTNRPVIVIGQRIFVGFEESELDQVVP